MLSHFTRALQLSLFMFINKQKKQTMKIENFKNWSLNENSDQFTELSGYSLPKIDVKFATDFVDLFTSLNRLNGGSEEDSCLGNLIFEIMDIHELYYPDSDKYDVLKWYYGNVINNGVLDFDSDDVDASDIERFKEENEKENFEEAKKDIDKFLEFDKMKSRSIVYLYELCYQIHNELPEPEELENSRWYNDTDIWELVKSVVIMSHTDFGKVIDMLPEWFSDISSLVAILPIDDASAHKYRGRIHNKKFGL